MKIPIKKTKIISTMGPTCSSYNMIEKLIFAGTNVFRLNFSHGDHETHLKAIRNIRMAAKKLQTHIAILADLQGPKIRTGATENDASITLKKNSIVTITSKKVVCTDKIIYVNYSTLAEEVKPGDKILLNDGAVNLKIIEVNKKEKFIKCKVMNTGKYSSRKGLNFPNINLKIPSLTKKDKKDLKFLLEQNINYIAISFVRKPEDLIPLNNAIAKTGKPIKLIAKIEKPEAVEKLLDILQICDGIMVARGDLGVEVSPYKVPILQKNAIVMANSMGKIVIVATQMLESMVHSPTPTRAEATDVANAILDTTDAVMLSAETAMGEYPEKAVNTITLIANETEKSDYYYRLPMDLSRIKNYTPHAVCEAAVRASEELGNIPVMVFTLSGDTARYLSNKRNQSPIFAFTPETDIANTLTMAWNVTPFIVSQGDDFDKLIEKAETILLKRKLIKKNDLVIIISGTVPTRGATSFMKIKKIEEN